MPQPLWIVHVGWAKETVWGTPVTPPTSFFTSMAPVFTEKQDPIPDKGLRGIRSETQAWTFGAAHTEFDLPAMPFYPNDSGQILMGILGADAITGAGPTYTHTMTVLNTGLPPSYTLAKYDGLNAANARQIAGCYLEEVSLKFANPGKLEIGAKGRGKLGTNVAKGTPAYDAAAFYAPWMGVLTLNTIVNARLINCSIQIKAPATQVFGMNGSQSPSAAVPGQLTVIGTMTFVPDDYTEFNLYLNNTQPPASIQFTNGANTFTIQMSKCAFIDTSVITHPSPNSILTATFEAIANVTDAGVGNAPIKCVLVNTKAVAY